MHITAATILISADHPTPRVLGSCMSTTIPLPPIYALLGSNATALALFPGFGVLGLYV